MREEKIQIEEGSYFEFKVSIEVLFYGKDERYSKDKTIFSQIVSEQRIKLIGRIKGEI